MRLKPFAALDLQPLAEVIGVRTLQAACVSIAIQLLLRKPFSGPVWRLNGVITASWLAADLCFVFVAPWRWGLPVVTEMRDHGVDSLALTFDDGPDPEITPHVLDALAAHEAKATFFLLQEPAEKYPDLVARMLREGHAVGVHGRAHDQQATRRASSIAADLAVAQTAIAALCDGRVPSLYRPPYGFKSLSVLRAAARRRLRVVLWSVDSRDYLLTDPKAIARRVGCLLRPGAIVLMHDGPGRTATADALPRILEEIARRGMKSDSLHL
jgi:peptidoglycan/xylan/chitin deacetylase (PgdA/CDA1 family)